MPSAPPAIPGVVAGLWLNAHEAHRHARWPSDVPGRRHHPLGKELGNMSRVRLPVERRPMLSRPSPRLDSVTQGFWDATRDGVLAIQRCASCRRYQHPPCPLCRNCGSTELGYEAVSGQARLLGWTTTRHPVIAGFESALPYTCLVVELVEQPGLFLLSDLIGRSQPGRLMVGMAMRVVFPGRGEDGPVLPQFEPAVELRA